MTYLQILRLLERYAWNQPDVHSVVREFTDLNREDAQYSAVVIQDRDGERDLISDQDWITYTWHIGYVDRLWEEKNEINYGSRQVDGFGSYSFYSNRDDIYSQGIRVINNIIAGLRKDYDLDITTPDRINTFNQRFTAECAGVYMVIAVTVPVSDCEDSGVESMYDTLNQRFTANGTYHFVPEGKPWDQADIEIDVHPQEPLITNFTENGTYDLEGEWKDAQIGVFVHPSTSLSETYTENGTYNIDGEFNGGQVTVAVDNRKPEESLVETITSNGSYSYVPQEGYVYDSVSLSVDVHPSTSLSASYTENGTYTIADEFNGGAIDVNVHPSTSLSVSYSSNGVYPIQGEFNGGEITVAVSAQKPEESLVETITSNGSYNYTPQAGYVFSSVRVNVSVPDYYTETVEYLFGNCGSVPKIFYYDSSDGGDYTDIISALPSGWTVQDISQNGTKMFYTTTDSRIIDIADSGFNVNIVSNTYGPYGGEVVFDGVLTDIYDGAFSNNAYVNLRSIVIPSTVTSIGPSAFRHCGELINIDVDPNNSVYQSIDNCIIYNNQYIGTEVLVGCVGAALDIPSSVVSIGAYAFSYRETNNFVVPSSIEYISAYAFEGWYDSLTSITIPSSVYGIGEGAFWGCGLTSITIPSTVTEIGPYPFGYNIGLNNITVDLNNVYYDSRNNCNCIIETSTNKLIQGCNNSVIPSTVTSIGSRAFEGCVYLTSITIPYGVTEIPDRCFAGCYDLTSITIPSSVTEIGEEAFSSSGLTSVTIPSSVTSICAAAFVVCDDLSEVIVNSTIPPSLGQDAFYDTSSSLQIKVPASSLQDYLNAPGWSNYASKIVAQ